MFQITPAARAAFAEYLNECPDVQFRIQYTPSCGSHGLSLTENEFVFSSDVTLTVDGVPFVYAKNLAHLVEGIRINLLTTEDGPEFIVESNSDLAC